MTLGVRLWWFEPESHVPNIAAQQQRGNGVERIYVTYELLGPDQAEAYERWSIERDQRVLRTLDCVLDVKVFMLETVRQRDRAAKIDVIEELTVSSWEALEAAMKTEVFQELGNEFGAIADRMSESVFRARQI